MSPEVINGLFALGGAAVGAVIGGSFTLYGIHRSKDRKELSVFMTRPSRPLVIDDRFRKDIHIFVAGDEVENVIISDIFVSNTGNKAVSDLVFPISFQGDGMLLSAEIIDPAIGETRNGHRVSVKENKLIECSIDLLNPYEKALIRCLTSGYSVDWSPDIRQENLIVNYKRGKIEGYADIVLREVYDQLERIPFMSLYLRLLFPPFRRYVRNARRSSRRET
jgi:hypothetical protein